MRSLGNARNAITDNVVEDERGCWIWQKGRNGKVGYGKLRGTTAHRYSWTVFRGPVPDGLYVCHACDVRLCVNPAHLFLGTQKDNIQDMIAKGRARRGEGGDYNRSLTHCRRGHEFTPENTSRPRDRAVRQCCACKRMRHVGHLARGMMAQGWTLQSLSAAVYAREAVGPCS